MLTSHRPRRLWPSLVASFVVLAGLSCSETGVSDTPVAVSALDVSPSTIALTVGQSQSITATPKSASGKSLTARPVQWSSSAANIAAVSTAGVVTGVAAGNATITAAVSDVSRQVTVTVTNPTFTLTITGGANGNGTVTSAPTGITCVITNGATGTTGCSAAFTAGTSVTLTATPASGSNVAGWSGACGSATGATCTLVMSAARTASVLFSRPVVAPVVTTEDADQITNSSARLNGTIVQDGAPYTTWFEFATNSTLTNFNITAGAPGPPAACPGTATCLWSDRLTGLPANTTFFFRMVANNAAGMTRGPIRSFTTLPNTAAPVISSLSATLVTLNASSCTFSDGGANGSLFAHAFSFTDPNGDVAFTGTPVTVTFQFQPSGTTGNFTASVFSSTGTGSSGTVTIRTCWRFGSDASFNYTVSLRDAAGNTSNSLSASVTKPAGANSAKPGTVLPGGTSSTLSRSSQSESRPITPR